VVAPNELTLQFYEKPGCINNTKQKKILRELGFQLEEHNLLTTPWSVERLQEFFATLPVTKRFNNSAPAIKEGSVKPENLDDAESLEAMIRDPILIRRPLIRCGDVYKVGFDLDELLLSLGVELKDEQQVAVPDGIEQCARLGE